MDKPRIFVDEESVRNYVNELETGSKMIKLESSLIKNVLSKREKRDVVASKELSAMIPDLEVVVPAMMRDNMAMRPEDTDK
jgi:hypothetical protein